MAGDGVEPGAACKLPLDIRDQGFGRVFRRRKARRLTEQHRVYGQKPPRLLIRGSPHHHAVDPRAMRQRLIESLLLAGAGAALGLVIAWWTGGVLLKTLPFEGAGQHQVRNIGAGNEQNTADRAKEYQ